MQNIVAARRCAIGAFAHSGQICISVQHIYVDQTIASTFKELLIAATEAIHVGDPLLDQTDVGPMIAEKEAERIEQWVSQAEQGGAVRLHGGQREGAVYYPTLLDKTSPDMQVMRHEVFRRSPVWEHFPASMRRCDWRIRPIMGCKRACLPRT